MTTISDFSVEDDCINVLENTTGPIVDLDSGGGANPDVGLDICMLTDKNVNGFGEDTDKPTSYTLSLGDALTSDIDSSQGDKLEVGPVMGADSDGDGSYLIRVSDDDDWTKTDKLFFEGDVAFGESFTASEAAFGTSFGSETYVHILSSDGSTVLQTINFHTSCSAPLVIGDQYGSVSLEGASLVGKDSGTVYEVGGTSAPGDEGVTYSIQDGPGSDLFEVNADGEVSFREAPDFEDPQGILDADGNPTNNYEVVVLATLEDGSVIEKPVEICVEDDCINVLENTTGPIVDLDSGGGANPDVGLDICMLTDKNVNGFGEDTDKPTSYTLSLGDALTSDIDSSQGDKLEVGPVMGADSDGDGSYLIRVSDDDDWTKTDKLFFEGDVAFGESFTASEAAFGTSFGSETYVHILSSDGSTVLQTINFHTSCSAPLVIGDQYGSVSLEGASLVGKDSGTVYEVGGTSAPGDEGVTYSIQDGPGSDLFEVNADGEVSFREAPDFEDPQGILDADGNPTNNYEVVVLATLEDGSVIEKPVEICVEDDCINVLENTTGPIVDLDSGGGANPDVGLDICMLTDKNVNGFGEDTDKPTSYTLSLGDALTSDIDSSQGDKLEVGPVMGADSDGDGSYLIRVSDDDDWTKTDKLFFEGDVAFGESFTASEAAFGTSFGSETYVHILSSDGSTVLQTINFHTSCSAPLVIGDQYGSVSLEGASLVGKDSGTVYEVGGTSAPGDEGVTYSIQDGPGSDLFEVNADGEVSFREAPDFEDPQGILDADGNPTNNYEVVVLATLEDGSVIEKPVEICVEDQDCIKVLENSNPGILADLDCEDKDPQNPDEGLELCMERDSLKDAGIDTTKFTELTLSLRFNDDGTLATDDQSDQGSKLDLEVDNTGADDGNGSYRVIVSGKDDPSDTSEVFFDATVGSGDPITALASAGGKNEFGSETYVHIIDDDGTLLQTVNFHTSCSAPIAIGDGYYGVQLDGASFANKDTQETISYGVTNAAPREVVYEITGGDGFDAATGTSPFFDVDPQTGEVTLAFSPDFENPLDDNGDNNYFVEVTGYFVNADGSREVCEVKPVEICIEDVVELGSIAGRYFCDLDGDGLDNNNGDEPAEAGVRVFLQLRDAAGNISFLADTVTDANGDYFFEDLPAGEYRVIFAPVAGKVFVDPNVGQMGDMDPADDSDVVAQNPVTGRGATDFIQLADGEDRTDLDAGVEFTASLGDFVFEDTDADGIQDAGEAGIGGVGVTLTGGGADGLISTTGDNTTATTTTAADGSYAFTGLNPGEEYQVSFDTPAGFVPSPADQGGDDTADSDGLTTGIVTLASGENNPTLDQGFYELASLGDRVFEDTNGDGIQDGGEPGVPNVTVELLDGDANVIATDTTDANGDYLFEDLVPGDYQVRFTPPTGFGFTTPNQGGDDALDSDADPTTGLTQAVTLESGENNLTLDAGLVRAASLGDFVFEDTDADGIQDAGEAGIGGVGVTLTGGGADGLISTTGDNTTATTTTAADGSYAFTGLNPGEEYQVSFDTPAGFVPSPADQGGDDTADSDGLTTGIVTLASGENNPTLDQGFYELASLGDRVFEDTNGDGIQDGGEPGVPNVTVELLDGDANVIATDTTDANGDYLFEDLVPGDYQVRFTPPTGFGFTTPNQGGDDALDSDADPTTGLTQAVTLESGENNLTLDAGLVRAASLGDFVFEDTDADGIQDAGEAGIGGVGVTLTGGGADGLISTTGDNTTATTTTAADGSYAFTGLNPGEEYQVSFDTPAGFVPSPADQGGDDTADSDGLTTGIVTLASGENNPTLDQGFYELASLGDRVFEDTNGDGIQDGGEPGVPNVTVELLDGDANVIATDTTDANGDYLFEDLVPGDYQVRFTPPTGFGFTTPNQGGDDALDSDADPTTGLTQAVTLESGENNLTLDAGLVRAASLGDFVFEDTDADGIQDAGEAGIGGVGVTLTGGGADGLISTTGDNTTATTTTAADGSYAFTGLNPGEEYQVSFDTPAGFVPSPADQGGDDTADSDGLTTGIVTLASGENNPTLDQGFYELASLGDRVFEDTNGDGIQDGGEPGVPNVTVELLDGDANVIATDTTDANGDYLFEDLVPGDYQVRFTPPTGFGFTTPNQGGDDALDSDADPTTGLTQAVTLESGENNLTLDAGLVRAASLGDFVFEDTDADGIQDAGEAGIGGVGVTLTGGGADGLISTTGDNTTATTTTAADGSYAFTGLNPGEEYQVSFDTPAGFVPSPADQGGDDTADSDGLTTGIVTLASGENNPTLDQGFYELASLGDRVFEDTNGDGIQDGGEPGVPNVTVELLDGDANVIATDTTDANGDYLFEDLVPGDYQVRFTPPTGFGFTTPNQGGDDALDSDADPTTGLTQAVTLESGENNLTLDAGLVRAASLGDFVFEDTDADGIQDAGEAGIGGVGVTLTGGGADGLISTTGDNTTATTTTAADGSYAFTGLNPGEEYQVSFDTPAGFVPSPADQGGDDTADSDGLTTGIVTLASGENNPTLDQGFYELASLGDRVFEDTNGDGIQDGGEPGVPNVTVELLDGDANVIATDTTDANGDYLFEDLVPGDYQVRFTPPTGFGFTTPNQGGDDALDSDADPTTGLTQAVTLESGENNLTLDAGLVRAASLGDFVFEDTDADGIQDAGEAGIGGVGVTLTGGGADGLISTTGDNTTATTTTAADGSYAFTGLNPGEEYQVSFDTPAGFVPSPADQGGDDTADSDGLTTGIVTLASGENNPTLDQGFYELASLGDRVFEDTNGDGIQDGGEPGVPNVTVELLDGDANVIATDTTDANGDYLFEDLVPGDYQVRFTPPTGFGFTTPNQGGDDALDSDADPTTGLTQAVTLESGENNLTLDAGLVRAASLGDFVFEDTDADGIQDAGEAGIGGVGVTLTGGGADGLISTTGDNTTATTTTAADGSYAFTGLNPGEEYQVSFDTPAGFVPSPADQGGDDTADSDGLTTGIVTLASGENNPTLDQGFYELASLGDRVFEDTNGDGIQDGGEPGVPNVTVELLDGDGNIVATTTTANGGAYSFTGLMPGTYSVAFTAPAGFAFTTANAGTDNTIDSDADAAGMTEQVTLTSGEFNGTLDAGIVALPGSIAGRYFVDAGTPPDPALDCDGLDNDGDGTAESSAPVVGATVELLNASGVVIATTNTDDTGAYKFTNLPAGDYSVRFAPTDGAKFTDQDVDSNGFDDIDSDVAPNSGETDTISLAPGQDVTDVDAGICPLGSVGDTVWFDTNENGLRDNGEASVDGVEVKLLRDGNGDGDLDDPEDVLATTTTSNGGQYLFTGLSAGAYAVMFAEPDGYDFTTQGADADDAVNDDSDAGPGGMTETFILSVGEDERDIDAGLVAEVDTDAGKGCADEDITVDFSDNFSGPFTVTAINGQAISAGGLRIIVDGVDVTLTSSDEFVFDGEDAYAGLDIGDEADKTFEVTLGDGQGNFATTEIDVTFCGDANTYQSLSDSLPTSGIFEVSGALNNPSAFDMTISGTGDARFDPVPGEPEASFDAYCLAFFEPIPLNTEVPADIFGAEAGTEAEGVFEPSQKSGYNGNDAADNLDLIKYIVAQDYESQSGFDGWDVQLAIWELTDTISTSDRNFYLNNTAADQTSVNTILLDAASNGEGFEFGDSGQVGMIFDPNPKLPDIEQPFIVAFDFENYDCIC